MSDTNEQQAQVEWTHEYRDDEGYRWRFGKDQYGWQCEFFEPDHGWSVDTLESPQELVRDAKENPGMYSGFRVIREPAPTVEEQAPAWTAGAVKAWTDNCPSPCRVILLPSGAMMAFFKGTNVTMQSEWTVEDIEGSEGKAIGFRPVPVLPAPEPTPQPEGESVCRGCGEIEPKHGPGCPSLDAAPATAQPDPDRPKPPGEVVTAHNAESNINDATYWATVADGASHHPQCARNLVTKPNYVDGFEWVCLRCQLEDAKQEISEIRTAYHRPEPNQLRRGEVMGLIRSLLREDDKLSIMDAAEIVGQAEKELVEKVLKGRRP